jgi:hypothetical protein
MARDDIMRHALRVTAVANLGVAIVLAFPASLPGQLIGLPASVPAVHRLLLAYLVGLFGVAYAWLARQPRIDRPLVAVAAAGKAGAAAIAVGCWLAGRATGRSAVVFSGDILFAALFTWWLRGERRTAA